MKAGTDEAALRDIFSEFGEISNINHRGTYAFVEFISPESASSAIKEMTGKGEMRV